MSQVVILGCGMVGSTIAIDLARAEAIEVAIADSNASALANAAKRVREITKRDIATIEADLGAASTIANLAADADAVIGALPSRMGYEALRAVLRARRPYVDISFMAEDARALDQQAKQAGVVAVVDCGVAPGLSNMIGAACAADLEPCRSIAIYIGGVPRDPQWPFFYKAAFAPADVIEEYTRRARLVENGRVVTRDALADLESLEFHPDRFPGVGVLDAFNTDGLRTLIDTLHVPHMVEKTLRHPGHAELMLAFRETGLFDEREVEIRGIRVRPRDLTAQLLFPKWSYQEGESDLTIMRIVAEGRGGKRIVWEMFDERDSETRCSSMSRTTAFPATFICREILAGRISEPGVVAPEELIRRDRALLDRLIDSLRQRGVDLYRFEMLGHRYGSTRPGR